MRDQNFKPTSSILFRVDEKMHNKLRKLAYSTGMPMAAIIRKSIEKMFKEQNKLLTD